MRHHVTLQLATCLFLIPNLSLAADFSGIGVDSDDFGNVFVRGISSDGLTVVGNIRRDGNPRQAFRWTPATGVEVLDVLDTSLPTIAWDVSGDGSTIAGMRFRKNTFDILDVFVWTEQDGTEFIVAERNTCCGRIDLSLSRDGSTLLAALQDGGLVRWTRNEGVELLTLPPGVSSPGSVEVAGDGQSAFGGGDGEGFYWSIDDGILSTSQVTGQVLEAPDLFGAGKTALFESGTGFIANTLRDPFTTETIHYKWSESQGLTPLGSTFDDGDPLIRAEPTLISEDGQVVAGVARPDGTDRVPWVWTASTGMDFIDLPQESDEMIATAMPSDGTFILLHDGRRLFASEGGSAYLWTPDSGLRALQDVLSVEHDLASALEGWTLNGVWGTSDDGMVIVGEGTNPAGRIEAWIANLRPTLSLPGDYNNNGLVEQGDLDLVLLHWGADADGAPPAWTNDLPTGTIDQDELDKVLLEWGNSFPTDPVAMVVPEPSSFLLVAILLLIYVAGKCTRTARRGENHLMRTTKNRKQIIRLPGLNSITMNVHGAPVLVLAVLLTVSSTDCQAAEFFGLDTGPNIGGRLLSGDGITLILEDVANPDVLLWRRGKELTPLGFPEGFPIGLNQTVANQGEIISDISDNGGVFASIFARQVLANTEEATFIWDEANGYTQIGPARVANFSGEFHRLQLKDEGESLWITKENNVWRWTDETGLQPVEIFPGIEDILVLDAHGSSAAGSASLNEPGPDSHSAFLWTPQNGAVDLNGAPGIQGTSANAMTPDGLVVVGSIRLPADASRAFRWSVEDGMTTLGLPSEFEGMTANFVSDDGSVVAGEFRRGAGAETPFVWTEASGTVPIDGFRDPLHSTHKLTSDGSRLFFQTLEGPPPVFTQYVWDRETGTHTLEEYLERFGLAKSMDGWQFSDRAPLVSDDGNTIVGRGIDPNGMSDLWIAILSETVALPGDYNNDGLVEQGDLDLVLLHWGDDATTVPATWTNDLPTGTVDQEELDKVLLGWGSTSSNVGAESATVPEPKTVTLGLIAAFIYGIGILFSRRVIGSSVLATSGPPRKENPGPFARLIRLRVFIWASIVVAITSSRAPAAEFFGIGRLSGEPFVNAVSADGSTIVGNWGNSPFRWSMDSELEVLDLATTLPVIPIDLNADGSVVAGFRFDNNDLTAGETFVLSQEEGIQIVGPSGNRLGTTNDVSLSADGASLFAATSRGLMRWTREGGTEMLSLPQDVVTPKFVQIAHNGQSAFGGGDDGEGFYWTADDGIVSTSDLTGLPLGSPRSSLLFDDGSGFVAIGPRDPATTETTFYKWSASSGLTQVGSIIDGGNFRISGRPSFVSEDGSVVAGNARPDGTSRIPWFWTEAEGMRFIQLPPGADDLLARAMPSDGSFILLHDSRWPFATENSTAYVWDTETGLRNLQSVLSLEHDLAPDLSGWTLRGIWGVSADGQVIVGDGTNPAHEREIWVADLREPLPSVPGDYNNNGLVEQADLDLVLLHWGSDAANVPSTWTNDLPTGSIDQDELDKVLLGWGSSADNIAATAGVPEPTSLAILLMALLLLVSRNLHRSST